MKRQLTLVILLLALFSIESRPTAAQPNTTIVEWEEYTGALDPDAVVVTQKQLLAHREEIVKFAKEGTVFFQGELKTLVESLDIAAPFAVPSESVYVTSFVFTYKGRMFVGGDLRPKGEVEVFTASADYFVQYLDTLSAISELVEGPQTASLDLQTFSRRLYLPYASQMPRAYWEPMPVLVLTLDHCPYGKYVDIMDGQRVINDADRDADYWGLHGMQQMISGRTACSSSAYRNKKMVNSMDIGYPYKVYRYDPKTTSGESSTDVNIGIRESGLSIGWSWSFRTQDVTILDLSDFTLPRLKWEFSLAGNPSLYTYTAEPGVSMKTPEGVKPLFYRPINLYWQYLVQKYFADNWYVDFN